MSVKSWFSFDIINNLKESIHVDQSFSFSSSSSASSFLFSCSIFHLELRLSLRWMSNSWWLMKRRVWLSDQLDEEGDEGKLGWRHENRGIKRKSRNKLIKMITQIISTQLLGLLAKVLVNLVKALMRYVKFPWNNQHSWLQLILSD